MKLRATHLPPLLVLALCAILALYGAVPQLSNYHAFADTGSTFGMRHAGNVLSNAGFALVALWGLARLWPQRRHTALQAGWPGYLLFLTALLLTAAGSSFYHAAPDDFRLVWDRLPIAQACAGLLAAVRAETVGVAQGSAHGMRDTWLLALLAAASVGWWYASAQLGSEDLRPYLLLQILPLLLIPLWQAIYRSNAEDRAAFGWAIALYVLAKGAELSDHALLTWLGGLSGHALKHLLATAAAAVLVARLVRRTHIRVAPRPAALRARFR